MGCLLVLVALFSPRLAVGLMWIFTPWVDRAFGPLIWPILGIIFLLMQLTDYAILHFASEERLMAEYAIADATEHRQMHRRLIDDVRSLRLDSNMPDLGLLLRYLREWLIRHIDGPDKELGRALQAKGRH